MKFGMPVNQRSIILIPVPFTDLSSVKRRPVLVLSNTEFNARNPDILVAAITAKLSDHPWSRIIDSSDMESGVLPARSLVRADKLYTLHQSIVVKTFGHLRIEAFNEVLDLLRYVLQNDPQRRET